MSPEPRTFTELLELDRQGRRAAADSVIQIVYKELRRLAYGYLSRSDSSATLQPTELVHEAYLRLVDHATVTWKDRAHFFNLAAMAMRQILVEHARSRGAAKRGGGAAIGILPDENSGETIQYSDEKAVGLLALDDALNALGQADERKAKILEMRYFGGLTMEESAEALGLSPATVGRETRYAEAWLRRELTGR